MNKKKDAKRCLIIAEAGVNHNGDLDTALKLCDAALGVGADVVKFQTWITDKLITKHLAMAEYQKNNVGVTESQYDMLERLCLKHEAFSKIKEHCDEIGIQFASTADEKDSLDFLVDLGIPFIKIGSGDIGNTPFLRYIGSKEMPIIMSTGMSTLLDVENSIKDLKEGGAHNLTLLHCTTNYPCPYTEVNLHAMCTLKDCFQLPVGYSDHTVGDEIAVSAVSLGACVIEKHFTLDRTMEGPDHAASTEPEAFKQMVKKIRNTEAALGTGIKEATESEKRIKNVITKRIVAAKRIECGEALSEGNICVKRNDVGELASKWDEVIGTVASKSYEIDQGIIID